MHPPIFVREPSAEERARLAAALRASDAFTMRRARIVLLSAEGRRPREIARGLRCAAQTVRDWVHRYNAVYGRSPLCKGFLGDPRQTGANCSRVSGLARPVGRWP